MLEHLPERTGRRCSCSEPGEIVFDGEFYDYEAKYTPGGMELLVPARISPPPPSAVRELALRAFRAAGCDGLARVDFFVDGEQVLRQRAQHDAGLHPDERLPEAARRLRRPLPASSSTGSAGWRSTRARGGRARGAALSAHLNSVMSAIVADWLPGGSVVIHSR